MAEEVGFEPTNGCPLPVFKTGAFNRSATLPLTPGLLPSTARPRLRNCLRIILVWGLFFQQRLRNNDRIATFHKDE